MQLFHPCLNACVSINVTKKKKTNKTTTKKCLWKIPGSYGKKICLSRFTFLSSTEIYFSPVQLTRDYCYGLLHLKLHWGELLKCSLINSNAVRYIARLFGLETWNPLLLQGGQIMSSWEKSPSSAWWNCWSSAAGCSAGGVSLWFCLHAGVNLEICCKVNRPVAPLVKLGEGSLYWCQGRPWMGSAQIWAQDLVLFL